MSLAQDLKKTFQPLTEAEQFLRSKHIAYEEQPDGTLAVDDLDLSNMKLEKLPDLTKVIVKGYFSCSDNELISLTGAPTSVGEGFYCGSNRLTSLIGAPTSVGKDFWCRDNQLTSLIGAPASVGENFYCGRNRLTSLVGAPTSVGKNFYCSGNQLTSLECAPQTFKALLSDFGGFTSWDEVPEDLRVSPETKAKEKQAYTEKFNKIVAASEKRHTFKPAPSIRFKTWPK